MPDDAPIPAQRPPGGSMIDLAGGVQVAETAVRFQFARSGGPGGQNVNKLNTKAELWVDPAGITGMTETAKARLLAQAGRRVTTAGQIHLWAETERSQERNREAVMEKLRELVLRALTEPKRRRKTRPSAGSKRRRLETKRRRGEIKAKRRGGAE